jgi:hypothetical protein
VRRPARTVAAGVLAVVVTALTYRAVGLVNVPGAPAPDRWVLQDFRDAVYYPAVALLDGRNPYDQRAQADAYPVDQAFPLYLPVTLLVHLPFALLPPAEAGAAYFVVTLALTAVLAVLALGGAGAPLTAAGVLGLTAALLASRPGEMNLLLGQVTVQVAIGCAVALRWARSRPLVAGLGLALAMLKPTYGVPLAALMLLGRGDLAATLVGGAMAAAVSLVAVAPLVHAAGGVAPFVTSLGSSAAAFAAEDTSNAWSSIARIDATAFVARLIGRVPPGWMAGAIALVVLGVAVAGLRRLAADRSAASVQLGVGLACLTILVASYHQAYDALLLAQPAVALATGRWGRGAAASPALRWTVLALLAVPAVNYLATRPVAADLRPGSAAWLAITAANPAALLGAWVMHAALCWRPLPNRTPI